MTAAYDWRGDIGNVWAEEWKRTDRTLEPVNDALVAALAGHAGPGARILDIGCGAGATSLAIAGAYPATRITGVDLSEALVAVARERAGPDERFRFETGDAACWRPSEAGFDLIVSRHGVMFFEDPFAAFSHLHALGHAGTRLTFSCFRARADNEWMRAMRPVIERFAPETLAAPEPSTGPFAFADPARVDGILRAAGFAPPLMAPLDFLFVVGAGEDPVADALAYFRRVGPIAAMLRGLDEDARMAANDALTAVVADHRAGDQVVFRAGAWIVTSDRS